MSHATLENQVCVGTTLRQVIAPESLQGERSPDSPDVDQRRPTGILVIEDERLLRKALEKGLRNQGFAVWVAADGGEGVDLYRRVGAQIDVVLSDVQMPVLDGPKTLDALREINPAVRCCFMTGNTRPTLLAHLLDKRPDGLFIKPFAVAEVVAVLREVAGQPPTGNAKVIDVSTGGDSRDSSETQGRSDGDAMKCRSHNRPVPSALAALIELGGEWSAGRK